MNENKSIPGIYHHRSNDPEQPEVKIEIRATLTALKKAMEIKLVNHIRTFSFRWVKVLLFLMFLLAFERTARGAELGKATIYYNNACAACSHYIKGQLVPILKEFYQHSFHSQRITKPEHPSRNSS